MVKANTKIKPMQYIDLFSGCGGLALGLHKAGIHGIFAVEKNDDAFKTLQHNMMDLRNHFFWPQWLPQAAIDINVLLEKYEECLLEFQGKVDLLTGGPPCQGFSLAGRRNRTDRRNKLVHSYIKMVEIIQPTFILLENVKGFTIPFYTKTGRKKLYSNAVVKKLQELGYQIEYRLLDFSNYGVPQHRTRFVLFGVRKKDNLKKDFAKNFFKKLEELKKDFLNERKLNVPVSVKDALGDLLYANGTQPSKEFPKFRFGLYSEPQTAYQKLMRSVPLPNEVPDSHRFANHSVTIQKRFFWAIEHNATSAEYKKHFDLKKSSTKHLAESEPTPTLTTLPDDYIHYSEPRILTVREYARIQSFSDDYIFLGKYTTGGKRRTSEVPRYSQIGNAIPPLFGELAGIALQEMLYAYNN